MVTDNRVDGVSHSIVQHVNIRSKTEKKNIYMVWKVMVNSQR